MEQTVRYPIGDQSFREIIRNGCVYVDKTMYIHRMVEANKYYFLSRPRRFGKSLLVSTMEHYFRGHRELFKGLAIDRLEPEEWKRHAVLHLDFNGKRYAGVSDLHSQLNSHLNVWEQEYGSTEKAQEVDLRFKGIIKSACQKTGLGVVVLIDEYDKPIIDVQDDEDLEKDFRDILRGFYGVMKSCSDDLKFVFLTGVGKLGQVNVFSGLNNIRDISLSPDYSAICGITTEELLDSFQEGIRQMGEVNGWSYDRTVMELKQHYDGYHFARDLTDVYNPYSLLNALQDSYLGSYWYQTGTPTRLLEKLTRWDFPVQDLEDTMIAPRTLEVGDVLGDELEVLFYYTGHLTIKDYVRTDNGPRYVLGYPNQEVRESFFDGVVKKWTGMVGKKRDIWADKLRGAIRAGDIDGFLTLMKSFMAGNSYRTNPDTEIHYQDLVYIVSRLVGLEVDVERATSDGRIDMVIDGPKAIYIIEFKLDQSPEVALQQIEDKQYDLPYRALGKPTVKVGVNISTATRTIDSWIIR